MQKNPYPGKFIVVEGLDGSGQTTQAALLKKYAETEGINTVLTKEPTVESEAGRKIRRVLGRQETVSPQTFQELFAKDREEHLHHLIIPSLRKGVWVISDRYFFSSFAYGAAHGVDLEYLIKINKRFLLPDFSFFLRVTPELCIERIGKRGEPLSYFESLAYLKKAWNVFELIAHRFENIHMINGEQPIEKVAHDIQEIILP